MVTVILRGAPDMGLSRQSDFPFPLREEVTLEQPSIWLGQAGVKVSVA